jgi:hypothetical protein
MNEILASVMSHLAMLFDGNMGWAILVLALTARLALLPLTLHLSRRMLSNQQKIKALQPQVDAIKARLADKPADMFAAMSALYKETARISSTARASSGRWSSCRYSACSTGQSAMPVWAPGLSCG